MIFRVIFLVLLAVVLLAIESMVLPAKLVIFGVVLLIVLIFDFYTIKRVEFYKLLTVGVMLFISLVVIYIVAEISAKLNINLIMDDSLYRTIIFSAMVLAVYLSIQVGVSSEYFNKKSKKVAAAERKCLIDTSAIIDGRLLQISQSGFIPKSLVIPRFVIRELQLISDSTDHEKRIKGRRGLDLLKEMKNSNHLSIQISNEDITSIKTVDSKLVALCKQEGYKVITTDFNLFKVAQLEGIDVMNINHLASLIKPNINVGDKVKVYVSKKGNNKNQGVAFHPDDTMIIIENAERLIGSQVSVLIVSYIQNESGRMAFAKVANNN